MNDIVVATQAEYDNAAARIARYQNRPQFDIEAGRGMEIVEEVNYLMYNYLYNNENLDKTIADLSYFYFTPEEAHKIADYFRKHLPGDMFDIERGLNKLAVKPRDAGETETEEIPKIVIRNNTEKVAVKTDVEVSGYSYIEAFGEAHIIARNKAYVIARENVSVDAYDKTKVDAFDNSCVKAYHNALVLASDESMVWAWHKACVDANDKSKAVAFHTAYVKSMDDAQVVAHNKTTLDAHGKSIVQVYDQSRVNAWDASTVSAHDVTEIHALDSSRIAAYNYSSVLARDKACITARDNSLILNRGEAVAVIHDNAHCINGYDNNVQNLQKNLYLVMKHPRFANDPLLAARFLMQGAPYENKTAINRKYLAMGCNSEEETKRRLTRWLKTYDKDISYER
jgi:hypothetical protein